MSNDKNYGIVLGAGGESIFLSEQPYLSEPGLYQAAGVDENHTCYIVYWLVNNGFPGGFDEAAAIVELV